MSIIGKVQGHDGICAANVFLLEFSLAQKYMARATAALLDVTRTHMSPEDARNYDRTHKQMVRVTRAWNAIEHEREKASHAPKTVQDAAPKPCGWLAGSAGDGVEPMFWRREDAQRECDEYNKYERSRPDFDPENLRKPEPVYSTPSAATGKAAAANTGGLDDALRDMMVIQEACGLHTDEYAPGSVIEYIKELEADATNSARLEKFIDWHLRGGKRSEINPDGHMIFTTREMILAWLDTPRAAIAASQGKP